jgi:hypothetical protein
MKQNKKIFSGSPKQLCRLILLLAFISPFSGTKGVCQATDNGVNGQLKRMVYIQWNDWQPTPDLHWYGLPKNYYGWFYWRILNNGYWSGEDRRPMRTGGPFEQNYASLILQEQDDKKISDTANAMMQQASGTYLNMQGGVADIPYSVYFQSKFDALFQDAADAFTQIQNKMPTVFNELMNATSTQNYLEYIDIAKSRIEAIHQSFVDKGARMEGYLNILKDLQPKVDELKAYLNQYVKIASFPTPAKVNAAASWWVATSDAELVKQILKTYTF